MPCQFFQLLLKNVNMTKDSNDSNIKKKISFDISSQILEEMDKQRKKSGHVRSNWICIAIMEKLARERKEEKMT